MAAEKTKRPKKKGAAKAAAEATAEATHLCQLTDPRHERRYEPKASALAIGTVLVFSVGAVVLGVGVHAQWPAIADGIAHALFGFLPSGRTGPHPWSMYLLIAGAVLLVAVALFGQSGPQHVRVGDGGVAIERDESTIERIAWCDVDRLLVSSDAVTVQGGGITISVPRGVHAAAAARIVREATERIPTKAEGLAAIDPPAGALDPPRQRVDPPQIAGKACKASGKVVSFEKDARLCGQCGELYHKAGVPDRCLTCDARLR